MKLPIMIINSSTEQQVNEIIRLNEETVKYGLTLSKHEIMQIIDVRNDLLRGYGRIELGTEVINKLIKSFYNSSYIQQDMYMSTLMELQEVFYYMKNETEDNLSDDEIIEILREFFEDYCKGSIELLQGREIENFARNQRIKYQESDFLKGVSF
ncbi:DUF6323 family protein [Vallitalea guaymasensis]|uniref:Uncharacterized protein n=1 Tax=Vallitalea guaymasensis TaxID=1185412 RepID=A0A8J8M7K1_9FIRM|nr:DUF6323 family protein [Vallitalea guaymasensis]QUH27857.1 hypothetical protein HYG85_02575 [Vallitalea guaymasensis]